MQSVLIAGVSARAAAESAARAGYDVIALDAFADLDQHPSVHALSLPRDFARPFTMQAAADAARGLSTHAAVYLSSFENDPDAVRTLAAGRALWGNAPEVLRRVRSPSALADAFCREGFQPPLVVHARALARREPFDAKRPWMIKPCASAGGHAVRPWTPDQPVARGHYLQEFVAGVPGSIVFVAAHGHAVPLGVTRQLVGDVRFGASGFRYCGSVLMRQADWVDSIGGRHWSDHDVTAQAMALAGAAARSFALVGLNGIDFIVDRGVPRPIELNPRWSSSMELVERACGLPMFAIHADACARGALPSFDLRHTIAASAAHGKAIVFAREDQVAGDTRPWLADASVRDVPRPGERIVAGQPICTIFASGPDERACHAALVRRAEEVYDAANPWRW